MKYLLIGGQKGGKVCDVSENNIKNGYTKIPREADIQTKSFSGFRGYENPYDEYRREYITHDLNGDTRRIRALVLVGHDEGAVNALMGVYDIQLSGRTGYRGPKGIAEVIED